MEKKTEQVVSEYDGLNTDELFSLLIYRIKTNSKGFILYHPIECDFILKRIQEIVDELRSRLERKKEQETIGK